MRKTFPFIILFSLISLLSINYVSGQNVIRGKVVDKETQDPVIGVTVVELDENNRIVKGAITDVNGNYVINVSEAADILQFSFIGYESQIINIEGRTELNVELSSGMELEEVVVTATTNTDILTGQALRDRTTATARIDMDEMKNMSAISVDEALQGQVSGLDIMSAGAPGSASSIVIRGLSSLGNSTPLIVVNGIAQDVNISDNFDFAGSDQEDLGQLLNIAPQDIKSIEVLKDAASTAVWGSRGADGVLLIETLRGAKGKTIFNYNYRFTMTKEQPPIPMLNGDEYVTMQLEELQNARGIFTVPDEIAYDPDYEQFYNYSANTDWIGALTRTGLNHEHYFKFSGGGDKTAFFASLSTASQDGTTLNEAFRRLSSRINLDYNLSKKIKFSVNFNYTNSYKEGNYSLGGRNVRQMAYIKAPNMSVMEYDQDGNLTGEFFNPINNYQGTGTSYYNPIAVATLSKNDTKINNFQNSYVLNYKLADWFVFVETVSFQYSNVKNLGFLPYTAIGADWLYDKNNEATERNQNTSRISSRSQFIFNPIRTRTHSLNATLMAEVTQGNSVWSQATTGQGPSSAYLTDPSIGAPISSLRSNFVENRSFGMLGSVNYKYKDKYLASLVTRADASSSFGSNERWGVFPSISIGWRFSNEDWLSSWEFLDNGMLRAGYGQAGKEPSNPYDRYGLFVNANPTLYITNASIMPSKIDLVNLKWQTVESSNLGLELTFFKGRLYASADLYNKITSDILWRNYKIPGTSGFSNLAWFNGGKIQNKGWEAFIRYNFLRRERLSMTFNFNISQNNNAFLEFPDNFNNIVGTSIGNGTYPRMAQIGQPVGSFYGFRYLGVYSTSDEAYALNEDESFAVDENGQRIPMRYANGYRFAGGDAKYEDINHDGVIDIQDVVYLGDSNPKYTGGFGLNINYRQYSISSQFLYRTKFDIVNEIALNTEGMSDKDNQSKAVLWRWRNEGDNYPGMLPRAYLDHPANNLGSDRYVEDGTFLRLNNLTLTYRLKPNSRISKYGIEDLELGMNLRKIMTYSRYSGQDPEIPQTVDDPFWFGRDNGRTPPPKVYSFFVNIRF